MSFLVRELRGYELELTLVEDGRIGSLKLCLFAFCLSTLSSLVPVRVLLHQVSHIFSGAIRLYQCVSKRLLH